MLSFSVLAEDGFKVHVNSFDPDKNLEKIKSKTIETKLGAGRYISQTQELPTPFEMDKDLFYLKAQKRPMEYLRRKYPELPEDKIRSLKALVEIQA